MTDIVKLGYKSISEYYGSFNNKGQQTGFKQLKNDYNDIPNQMIQKIAHAVKKLHAIGISHGALHPGNVFTNGENIVFIDFSLSEKYESQLEAWENERYTTTKKFITAYDVRNTHIIPNNWQYIKMMSKPN